MRAWVNYFIISLFLAISAEAKIYEGRVDIARNSDYLFSEFTSRSKLPLFVRTTNSLANNDVTRLLSGDHLIAKATVTEPYLDVDSVEFVRLSNLVGFWENKTDGIQMNVTSINQLTLTKGINTKKVVSNNYYFILSPSEKINWVIYLYDETKIHTSEERVTVGVLTYNNLNRSKVLKLKIYNSKSDSIEFQTTLLLKKMKSFKNN